MSTLQITGLENVNCILYNGVMFKPYTLQDMINFQDLEKLEMFVNNTNLVTLKDVVHAYNLAEDAKFKEVYDSTANEIFLFLLHRCKSRLKSFELTKRYPLIVVEGSTDDFIDYFIELPHITKWTTFKNWEDIKIVENTGIIFEKNVLRHRKFEELCMSLRHHKMCVILATDYSRRLDPVVRTNVDYYMLLKAGWNLEGIYKNWEFDLPFVIFEQLYKETSLHGQALVYDFSNDDLSIYEFEK